MFPLLQRDRVARYLFVLAFFAFLGGLRHVLLRSTGACPSNSAPVLDNDLSYDADSKDKLDALTGFSEAYMNSKTWPMVKWPDRVVPYMRRGCGPVPNEDITITTTATIDKMDALRRLVEQYQGESSLFLCVRTLVDSKSSIQAPSRYFLRYIHRIEPRMNAF